MSYPSDLNDAEWQIIAPFLPAEKSVGSPREVDLRAVVNAIFYRADNGIKWRAMPIDFPPWQTVYTYYRLWVRLGVWEQINAVLVEQVRVQEGRNAQPSLIISDSQSVKAAQKRGANTASMATRRSKGASAI
jgi:transposase